MATLILPSRQLTKAEMLQELEGKLSRALIPRFRYFSLAEWKQNRLSVLNHILRTFHDSRPLAVRSSAWDEDRYCCNAGRYRTLLNVPVEPRILNRSIEEVIASLDGNPDNQILIQEMVQEADISGVILTHDLETGAPYYRIDYDDTPGRTDAVTSGSIGHKTVLFHRTLRRESLLDKRLRSILRMTIELESTLQMQPLDIEFAQGSKGQNYLLQVRSINVRSQWKKVEGPLTSSLRKVSTVVAKSLRPVQGLAGASSVFTQMSDWNPAELLGAAPRPLAVSLFHHLISKSVWQEARSAMGYRSVPDRSLHCLLAERPYIDVRLSFNSFLPAGLSVPLENTLVDAWLERLRSHPELHDRVEFEVAQTTIDFAFNRNFAERYGSVLSKQELAEYGQALKDLTNQNVSLSPRASLPRALQESERLNRLQEARGPIETTRLLKLLFQLLRECICFGTRPFAVVARHAFIAESLLRSAVQRAALTEERLSCFRGLLGSPARLMSADYQSVINGRMTEDLFFKKYGHLRPGTFDIESRRYDQRPDFFENKKSEKCGALPASLFELTPREYQDFSSLLKESNLEITVEGLLEYARRAISGREYAKFVFSRHLSDLLEVLAAWGRGLGLSRSDLSYLTLDDLASVAFSSCRGDRLRLRSLSIEHRKRIEETKGLQLGYIIRDIEDLYQVPVQNRIPNFITSESVEGKVICLDSNAPCHLNLAGQLVCIESADPGFDWIFTRGLAGLITKFGGLNSHMAIRCAEMRIPAAIGLGEPHFDRIARADWVELNCLEKRLRPFYA